MATGCSAPIARHRPIALAARASCRPRVMMLRYTGERASVDRHSAAAVRRCQRRGAVRRWSAVEPAVRCPGKRSNHRVRISDTMAPPTGASAPVLRDHPSLRPAPALALPRRRDQQRLEIERTMAALDEHLDQKLAPYTIELELLMKIPGFNRVTAASFIAAPPAGTCPCSPRRVTLRHGRDPRPATTRPVASELSMRLRSRRILLLCVVQLTTPPGTAPRKFGARCAADFGPNFAEERSPRL